MHPSRLTASALTLVAIMAWSATAHAGGRPDGTNRSWFGHIDGGYAFATGDSGDFLDDDWTIGGGVLFWPADWPVGVSVDVNYLRLDLSGSALDSINSAIDQDPDNDGAITGGDVETWQFALNGIWSLGPDSSNGFYLTGGITYNDVTGRISQTGLVYYPPVCDPFYWWWCFPGGVGPGQIVVGQRSADEFGWNLGAGYSFAMRTGGQLFVEARYQQIDVGDEKLEYIPLTVGFRW
jgi:opacity protein-like surface antigen